MISPAVVSNVQVMQDTATSVTVSWDMINSPFVTSFTVYYSRVSGRKRQGGDEMSVTVPSTARSAMVTGLVSGAQYQFQVTITISFNGVVTTGERSPVNEMTMLTLMTTTASGSTESESTGGIKVGASWSGWIRITISLEAPRKLIESQVPCLVVPTLLDTITTECNL